MGRLDFDHHRIASHTLCDLLNTGWVSGTKQQGLTLGWRGGDDRFQCFLEAHFEHAIGFIQYQCIEFTQIDTIFAQVIQNTPRRAYQNMCAMLKGTDLRSHRHTAA